MDTKRGVKRLAVVALGLAVFLAMIGSGPFHDRDAITTRYQDGSKRTVFIDGSASDATVETLACIKNKTDDGIGDPIIVDQQACPKIVSMEWVVEPPFYREPVGTAIWTLFLGVPLFFSCRWAVRGFRVEPLEVPCPWCGKMTPTRRALQDKQRAYERANEPVVVLMTDMCQHCGLGIGDRFG